MHLFFLLWAFAVQLFAMAAPNRHLTDLSPVHGVKVRPTHLSAILDDFSNELQSISPPVKSLWPIQPSNAAQTVDQVMTTAPSGMVIPPNIQYTLLSRNADAARYSLRRLVWLAR